MNCTKVFYAFPMSTANLHSSQPTDMPCQWKSCQLLHNCQKIVL